MSTWDNWYCPKCGAHNRVDLGNLNDQTAPDIEAVECYNCKHVDWIDEHAQDFCQIEKPEEACCEEGQPPCSYCAGTGVRRETRK